MSPKEERGQEEERVKKTGREERGRRLSDKEERGQEEER